MAGRRRRRGGGGGGDTNEEIRGGEQTEQRFRFVTIIIKFTLYVCSLYTGCMCGE